MRSFTKRYCILPVWICQIISDSRKLYPHMFFEHCFLIGSTPLSIKAIPTHAPLIHRKRDFDNRSKSKTENFEKLSWITASSALLQSPSAKKRCSAMDVAFGTIVSEKPERGTLMVRSNWFAVHSSSCCPLMLLLERRSVPSKFLWYSF